MLSVKRVLPFLLFTSTLTSAQSVEGYKDIYIDTDKDIFAHTIVCGDFNKGGRHIQPVIVFTNSANIEQGSYFYNSVYGEFSYTFKFGDKSKAVAMRGVLKNGETDKANMQKDRCVLTHADGLPKSITGRVKKDKLAVNDPQRNAKVAMITSIAGQPATAKGHYFSGK